MRFKLDENLPYRAAHTFVEAGHDADAVYDEDLAGQPDEVVLAATVSEDRVLVTLDLDFSDLSAYPIGTHCGIVVLRPLDDSRAATHARLMTSLTSTFACSGSQRPFGSTSCAGMRPGLTGCCGTNVARLRRRGRAERQACRAAGLSARALIPEGRSGVPAHQPLRDRQAHTFHPGPRPPSRSARHLNRLPRDRRRPPASPPRRRAPPGRRHHRTRPTRRHRPTSGAPHHRRPDRQNRVKAAFCQAS